MKDPTDIILSKKKLNSIMRTSGLGRQKVIHGVGICWYNNTYAVSVSIADNDHAYIPFYIDGYLIIPYVIGRDTAHPFSV